MPVQYGQISGIDKQVSRLVQGTIMLREETRNESFALLDAVYEAGGNAFDTARHYAAGTESTFGKWVRERGRRDEVVVIGKGAHPIQGRSRVTPDDITADLEESLRQFGFDDVDLYLLHRDDETVPVGPIVEVLDQHRRAGKIRAYGGSNWSHRRIADANA
jgi:aryl-alcohol dehydrogenase-like predicted oxidoreductase